MRVRILVVEDDRSVRDAVRRALMLAGYEVQTAEDGIDAILQVDRGVPDAVVLDIGLPEIDGLEVCRRLRRDGNRTPILMLTARDAVSDRIDGLDAGADDYLVKPFALSELLARIRALLRRGRSEPATRLHAADLEMDVVARRVIRGGRELDLTAREFELLEYLLRNKGRVVSREMLARDVWREQHRATTLDNVIDVHVARLRRKIDDLSASRLVNTIRGVGFIVDDGEP